MEGQLEQTADSLTIKARDEDTQLGLETRLDAIAGGSLRIRHTLRNLGANPFLMEGLEVLLPLDDQQTQILDFAGGHDVSAAPIRSLSLRWTRPMPSDGLYLGEAWERGYGRMGSRPCVLTGSCPGTA